ncbi:MAG: ribonuclease Z [Myxococcota bacterium]
MSLRELVVLGTASQVPTRHRNHNGYLLLWDGRGILFDPGEGTQRQMTIASVSTSMITRICVTHFHGDHCLGLAGIIQRISLDGVRHQVPIHYPASGQVYFDRLRRASIFKDESDIAPSPLSTPGEQHQDDVLILTSRPLRHTVESWGYRIEEPPSRRILPDKLRERGIQGPRIGELVREGQLETPDGIVRLEEVSVPKRGQAVAFVMDTAPCPAAEELAQGVDLLICESTYLRDHHREAHERGHMTAFDAATIAKRAGARKLVLSHFSRRYPRVEAFVAEAEPVFADVVAARDGLRVPVPARLK